ncbi:MAG: hypothetical protein IJ060_08525 [Oscillospiraceae bacterium]|nr:hypothetical protein [Oscillospiraceae bacterium]
MPVITIKVNGKIAEPVGAPEIVCGNSDCLLHFTFDSEWDDSPVRTLRTVWCSGGKFGYADTVFEGDTVPLPPVYNTPEIAVGVYAGNLRTTTPARIPCARCITDRVPVHADPPPDVYAQLLDCLLHLEYGESLACSDVRAVTPGGVSEDIIAIAEEVI